MNDIYDVYALTETWLTCDISSSELGFNNYVIYRCDRNSDNSDKSRGGGVLLAVDGRLASNYLLNVDRSIEHLFVTLNLDSKRVLLICAYFPPQSPAEVYERHFNQIEQICISNFVISH